MVVVLTGFVTVFSGKQWIKQMVISAFLLPINVCTVVFMINFIAIYYHASRAIPFGTMVSSSATFSNCLSLIWL